MKKLLLIFAIVFCGIANAQFTSLYNFNDTLGAFPMGSLVSDGTFLYGMTSEGGANCGDGLGTNGGGGCGVIFKIKTDGTGYDTLLSFHGQGKIIGGAAPWYSSLIYDGTSLYGMTYNGGAQNGGTVFKIKPDGTGYNEMHDFTKVGGITSPADGVGPQGSLLFNSNKTVLYGMTAGGGSFTNNGLSGGYPGYGTIFSINSDGSGYSSVLDLGTTSASTPGGDLVSDGTSLYGMSYEGGPSSNCPNGCGVLFKINPNGTGYDTLMSFSGTANGSNPEGSLIYDGTYLYGMAQSGGAYSDGVVFKIKPDGTGYSNLLNFAGSFGAFSHPPLPNGANPYGSLVYDGTFLYGVTFKGGANNVGLLFEVKPDGTGYTDLHDFQNNTTTQGDNPYSSLLLLNNCLYGMTNAGGAGNGYGTIFKYCLTTTTGIDANKEATGIRIYPNPSTGSFIIETSSTEKQILQVFDIAGKLLLTQILDSPKSTMDASGLAQGVYNFCVSGSEGRTYKRLVIVH